MGTTDKIHQMFIKGAINGSVFSYLSKVAAKDTNDNYSLLLIDHAQNINKLKLSTEEECDNYFFNYVKASKKIEQLTNTILSKNQLFDLCAFGKDYKKEQLDKLAIDFITQRQIMKQSYPNNDGIDPMMPKYDIEKWVEVLRTIYSAYNNMSIPMEKTAEELTAQWSPVEKNHFERWMKYYKEGDHLKYDVKIQKQAQFFPKQQNELDRIRETMEPAAPEKDTKKEQEKLEREEIMKLKRQLRGRISSMDKLLFEHSNVFPQKDLEEIVAIIKGLESKVRFLDMKKSIADCLIRGAGQLNKRGFVEGYHELKKIAQEVEQNTLPPEPAPVAAPVEKVKIEEPAKSMTDIVNDNAGNIVPIPNINLNNSNISAPDFTDSSLNSAISKLEEVNKILAERALVRALASCDIILGQLGLASFFPQLAEAQTKLLDSYQYASSRVSTTLSQMRGGQMDKPIKKDEDVIEVSEELEKPVSKVQQNAPGGETAPAGAPPVKAPAPIAPVKPPIK